MRPGRTPLHAMHGVLVGAMVSFGVAACDGCRAPAPGGHGPGATAESSPTLRVFFVSDLAGALEPCGCVKDQLGGLDHAAAWIEAQRSPVASSLLVAAGPTFFMNPLLEEDHRSQDVAKAEALASALQRLGLSGWAPAGNDWAAGPTELAKLAQATGGASALLAGAAPASQWVHSSRTITIHGVTVALIGVGAPPGGAGAGALPAPADAVKAASAAARAEGANLVIVLASVGRGEAKRIADAVPDLSAIIVGARESRGEANTRSPPGELVGNVLIAEAANHLQAVGTIDFYVRGDSYTFADGGGLGEAQKRLDMTRRIDDLHFKLANWERDRSIAQADLVARRADLAKLEADLAKLDAKPPPQTGSYFRYALQEIRGSLGEDPGVKGSLAAYYKLVNEQNRVALAGRVPPPPAPGQAAYTGIDACAECHKTERAFWQKTVHAGAYASLSTQSKEFNLDCVSCHVTGYGQPGGSTVTHVDKLKDVQCEVCHGPGSLHAASPKTVPLPTPGPDLCVTCHHSPHVEGFDAPSKMNLIVGPGHGG